MTPSLEKVVWTDADFDQMGWHDATLYAFTPLPGAWEFAFDIDYILKWVDPDPPDPYFSFFVAPATLVFHDVGQVVVDLQLDALEFLSIDTIARSDPRQVGSATDWHWAIELHQGAITFRAHGYHQFFRRAPVHVREQSLPLLSRGGISLARNLGGGPG